MPRHAKNKKRSRHDFFWICLFIMAICGVIIARQEYKIYQVNKELEATTQRVENLKKDHAELEAEKKRLDDLKYIEKLAREDHNMVGKDEVPLFIVDEKEKGQDNAGEGKDIKEQAKNDDAK